MAYFLAFTFSTDVSVRVVATFSRIYYLHTTHLQFTFLDFSRDAFVQDGSSQTQEIYVDRSSSY